MGNEHISTAEIEQDIRDTQQEIFQMERELPHLQGLAEVSRDRLADMRARNCADGIKERKAFISKLQRILDHRANPAPSDESQEK